VVDALNSAQSLKDKVSVRAESDVVWMKIVGCVWKELKYHEDFDMIVNVVFGTLTDMYKQSNAVPTRQAKTEEFTSARNKFVNNSQYHQLFDCVGKEFQHRLTKYQWARSHLFSIIKNEWFDQCVIRLSIHYTNHEHCLWPPVTHRVACLK